MTKAAARLARPAMALGLFPRQASASATVGSASMKGMRVATFMSGLMAWKAGVLVGPGEKARTSTPLSASSAQRLSPRTRLKALVAE
jgi:hypothetical protein